MNRVAKCVAALLLAGTGAVHAQSVTIIPQSPSYMQPVYARIVPNAGSSIYGAQVAISGSTLNVTTQSTSSTSGAASFDVMLGELPTGTYTVNVSLTGASPAPAQFTVASPSVSSSSPGNVPAVVYTDMWWNPNESGWGMSIYQGPTNDLFAVWFVYDASGNPTWYTLQPGQWLQVSPTAIYQGPIYKTSGPYYVGTFNPAQVTATNVGSGAFSFTDSSHATFSFSINGVSEVKTITREPI
jgi:hypothetical protein